MCDVICSGGFLMKNNKFLFGKRSKNKGWAPGLWDIPGGKAFKDEHPIYTLKREIYEETKVVVMNAELLTTLEIFDDNLGNFFTYHIYIVTHWKKKAVNNSKEHTKIRWFSRNDLNKISLALPGYLGLIDAKIISGFAPR